MNSSNRLLLTAKQQTNMELVKFSTKLEQESSVNSTVDSPDSIQSIFSLWSFKPSGVTDSHLLLQERVAFLEHLASSNTLPLFAEKLVNTLPGFRERLVSTINALSRANPHFSSHISSFASAIQDVLETSYGEIFTFEHFWYLWDLATNEDYSDCLDLIDNCREKLALQVLKKLYPNKLIKINGNKVYYPVLYNVEVCKCYLSSHLDTLRNIVYNVLIPKGVLPPPELDLNSEDVFVKCFSHYSLNGNLRSNKFCVLLYLLAKKSGVDDDALNARVEYIPVPCNWYCWETSNIIETIGKTSEEAKKRASILANHEGDSYYYKDEGEFD